MNASKQADNDPFNRTITINSDSDESVGEKDDRNTFWRNVNSQSPDLPPAPFDDVGV